MNRYQQRLADKAERLEERADRKEREAAARLKRSDALAGAMNGQPILVGHHSEKRHRRDLERMQHDTRRGLELEREASSDRSRAASLGEHSISSDDPEALLKLRARLADLEREQAYRKAVNAHWRKHKTMAGFKHPESGVEMSAEAAARIDAEMAKRDEPGNWVPDKHKVFPSYDFSNRNNNMRRIKGRIQELERREKAGLAVEGGAETVTVTELEYVIVEHDADENRVRIRFPGGKPDDACRSLLKSWGFRWSRYNKAWQRHLNSAGIAAAERIVDYCTERGGKIH